MKEDVAEERIDSELERSARDTLDQIERKQYMTAMKQEGITHFFKAMCNTGGNTWDIGMVPYLPAPDQWMKRYQGLVQ